MFWKGLALAKDLAWWINSNFIKKNLLYLIRNRSFKLYLKTHNIRKLQIGCGENILEGWLNTDLNSITYSVLPLDARKKLPFKDNTFDYIFFEHLLEHIEYSEGLRLVQECFRVLRPKGKIRISTPNLKFLIELYNQEKTELQKKYIYFALNKFFLDAEIYQDTFVINNFFRGFGHKFIYDFKVIKEILKRAGFTDIKQCEVRKSDDLNLQNIEGHGNAIKEEFNKLESIVVEAIKPYLSN